MIYWWRAETAAVWVLFVAQELLDNVESLSSIDRPAGGANNLGACKTNPTTTPKRLLFRSFCPSAWLTGLCQSLRDRSGGGLLDARAYRIKRSQLQERTGLHRKDAAFLRAFAAVRNYRLEVDQSPLDFCGCC